MYLFTDRDDEVKSTMMRNRSFRIGFALILLMSLLWPIAVCNASSNMVKNGGFEEIKGDKPNGWIREAWEKEEGITQYFIDRNEAHSGAFSAVIHNVGENHARLIQSVEVQGEKKYRISGYIKAEGLNANATGAHLYVEGVAVSYPELHETNGQWRYLEFYGETEKKQTEIKVGASVGGYGSLNAGKAWFDDLSVEQVSVVPEGAAVFSLAQSTADTAEEQTSKSISILSIMQYALLFTLLFAFVYSRMLRERHWLEHEGHLQRLSLAAAFMAALALRIIIAVSHGGYENDIALFMSWAQHAVGNGLSGFYNTEMFVDYPPGYIYILYGLGFIQNTFGLEPGSAQALLLYKLPAIAADLLAAAVIYAAARKKLSYAASLGLALVYLFNPAAIADSAAWGQVDAIFALTLVLAIRGIAEKKFGRASVWYAIAALVKPQAFIFMPVLLLALYHRGKWKQVAVSAVYGFATFLALALPFFWRHGGFSALIQLYKGTLSSYPYATLNAFNLYTLIGANWKPLEESWLFISYQHWGTAFIVAAVGLALYYSLTNRKRGGEDRSFFIAMVLIAVVFIFVTKMHERYMFPIFLLSVFAYIQTLDRRFLHLYFGFTITNLINICYVLAFSVTTTYVPSDGMVLLCSIANIGLLLYMLYIGYDRYNKGRTKSIEAWGPERQRQEDRLALEQFRTDQVTGGNAGSARTRLLMRKDWIWMLSITAVYALIALYDLGVMKGPVTVWQPASSGQSFYVDLGETKRLERITSFGGVGTGKYKYEFALTPDQWTNELAVESTHVAVFAWNSQKIEQEARYVKLTVSQSGFSMHELAFYEQGSTEPLPIAAVISDPAQEPRRGSVDNLFDEQELMVYNHNFREGSYFDEIYHARTAYENLEKIVAYENTHPPLGKLIIALGIKLFGLNPFGWRIAGTILGMGMLPIMYSMARRMFGSTLYAALATGLLAADFMHFTQTRIATIDVYAVFFIMLMFYFMNKYVSLNFFREKLAATLLPLGLAGLFFGLGVASKWIVLYGGAGLAVMLALSLLDRYRQYRAAKRMLKQPESMEEAYSHAALSRIVKLFPRNTILTLAACLVFYVLIPAGIYALSYIPILSVMDSGYTLKSLIDYQKHMFSYHSNLVSSHPFSSYWWEWPFMKRPVWYYSGSGVADGMKSTIVAMGNPLIWWTGIFAMLVTIRLSVKRKDKQVYMLWIAFLSQYIPWMLVPRETFLYHYFAMVPFIILSIVYLFRNIEAVHPRFVKVRNIYIAAAILLFVLFYPALSGMTVPTWYVDVLLRWFPSWVF